MRTLARGPGLARCIAEFGRAVKSEIMTESGLSRGMVLFLAMSCGVIVANLYYTQPLLGSIGPDLHMSSLAVSLIVSLTQFGYAVGLLFLVPLGDLVENRKLILVTVLVAIPPLLLAGCAWNSRVMLLVGFLTGLTCVAAQMLPPLAMHMTPAAERGRVVGSIISGLVFGILLSRPLASAITACGSWRLVFFLSAGLMALLAFLLSRKLPSRQPEAGQHYGTLLITLFGLPRRFQILRQRALYQAACFFGFSMFWTGAPLVLMHQFGFTQRGIAVFALVGAAGALSAPVAGHLADRGHTRVTTITCLLAVPSAFAIAWAGVALHEVVILALGGVILDAATQTNLVIGQRTLYMLAPALRSRLNGMFMALFFLGGACGSAVTGVILARGGWRGLCWLGGALALMALAYLLTTDRQRA